MPRKSAASLSVVGASPVGVASRLPPPHHLSEAERAVWLQLVNDQPADAFTQGHMPLLELYSRHVVNARVLAGQVARFDPEWLAEDDGLKRYDRLLAMSERETRAATAVARSLRITRQSLDHATVARRVVNMARSAKPWETKADDKG